MNKLIKSVKWEWIIIVLSAATVAGCIGYPLSTFISAWISYPSVFFISLVMMLAFLGYDSTSKQDDNK